MGVEPQAALSSILANSTLLHLVTLTLELLRDQRPEGLLTIFFFKTLQESAHRNGGGESPGRTEKTHLYNRHIQRKIRDNDHTWRAISYMHTQLSGERTQLSYDQTNTISKHKNINGNQQNKTI